MHPHMLVADSGTDWTFVVVTAVVAFAAAGFGAWFAGRITARQNRTTWLRETHAVIWRDVLPPVQDAGRIIVLRLHQGGGPHGPIGKVKRFYGALRRDVIVAGAADVA